MYYVFKTKNLCFPNQYSVAKPIEYVQTVRIYEIRFADSSLCKCQGIRLKIHFCQVEIHSFKKGFPQKQIQ